MKLQVQATALSRGSKYLPTYVPIHLHIRQLGAVGRVRRVSGARRGSDCEVYGVL